MQLSRNSIDALGEQLILLYKDLPPALRSEGFADLKTVVNLQRALRFVNDHITAQGSAVVLSVLKFTILSVLYQEVQQVLLKQAADAADVRMQSVPEQSIKDSIRQAYPDIHKKLLSSNKSVLEILGEHRNTASKLFCSGTKPRSLRMFDQWIAKDTRGVSLLGDDDPRSDDDLAP